jgi:hypothetical protein
MGKLRGWNGKTEEGCGRSSFKVPFAWYWWIYPDPLMRGRIESFVMDNVLPVRLLLFRMMARQAVSEYTDIAQSHVVCAFQALGTQD